MRLSLLFILVIAISCSPGTTDQQASADTLQTSPDSMAMSHETPAEEQQTDTSTPSAALQSITLNENDVDATYEDSLSKYFTPEQIIILKKAKKQFNEIKSVQDMAAYYPATLLTVTDIVNTQIREITPTEYSGDDSPDASWKWFGDYYPGFYGSVDCSECEYDIKTTFNSLIEKAKETNGNEDDMFFELCDVVYGGGYSLAASISNSPGWYQLVGCDFCAASLLGNGKRLEILQRIEEAAGAKQYFGTQMEQFQEQATTETFDKFFLKKTDIISELNAMLRSKILTPEQKTRLEDLRTKVSKGEVETECGSKDCKWPEY